MGSISSGKSLGNLRRSIRCKQRQGSAEAGAEPTKSLVMRREGQEREACLERGQELGILVCTYPGTQLVLARQLGLEFTNATFAKPL